MSQDGAKYDFNAARLAGGCFFRFEKFRFVRLKVRFRFAAELPVGFRGLVVLPVLAGGFCVGRFIGFRIFCCLASQL